MKLLLVRCGGPAEKDGRVRGSAGEERPLSPEQRRLVRESAAGLASAAGEVSEVLTSPSIPAVETAAIIAKSFDVPFRELPWLDPSARIEELLSWIGKQPAATALVLVGHGPALTKAACRLLGGRREFLSIKPAGACMLEVDRSAEGNGAKLHWVMTPRQLRRHAK